MSLSHRQRGFTLIEVLIAMAITAVVAAIAYRIFATVLVGAERTEASMERVYEVNRAWMFISRDLEQFVGRPVRDEFGEDEPAMIGGPAARFTLAFTRSGWFDPMGNPRPELQRVNYRVEDGALWRDSFPVLDRGGNTEPYETRLLEEVDDLQVLFLPPTTAVRTVGSSSELDTRQWQDSWVADTSQPGSLLEPPLAVEVRLLLRDWGEMRRIYVLPPI
ncbi:type II secretion system minor pseudopilin GspJ [Mangrovimicrobium sediminis]|uniref:type II secretion system minor pseudopilin GspJ n=1 Tax=Mangrovimicrobium sediminis TaxID=2562682 RepID=UPI001F104A4F|nr:type II secretion system minor pseudopilin GspJ [Haliea sp. SAOS-164]